MYLISGTGRVKMLNFRDGTGEIPNSRDGMPSRPRNWAIPFSCGFLWVFCEVSCGFLWVFPQKSCGNGMGMGIEIPFPRQPCWEGIYFLIYSITIFIGIPHKLR